MIPRLDELLERIETEELTSGGKKTRNEIEFLEKVKNLRRESPDLAGLYMYAYHKLMMHKYEP